MSTSKRVTQSIEAHQVIALALGSLMYILVVTGTLSVFNREFQRWEQPDAPEMQSISAEAAAKAATTVFESEAIATTHLYINFPQADLPRTVITTDTQAFFANTDGTIAQKEHFPWTQFLLDLHYYLHLPQILGLTIVGAIGAFLIAMSISGFMAHPRIFRDAFTFRRGAGLVPLIDLHNRLSVWTAPFHITNALTGAVLGLASVLAFAIAAVSFQGDIEKVFDPVFGSEPAPIEAKAKLANIAGPLSYMANALPTVPPTYYILHDPGTKGQHTSIIASHTDRLIFGEYYNFDSIGDYQGNVGISDGTLGQQIIGSIYFVHFGNWGGALVKIAYGVFGLILCIITASGLRIYFLRRQQKGREAPRLEAGWEAIVWGTPALLSLTLLTSIISGLETYGLVSLFWGGLCIIIAIAMRTSNAANTRHVLKLTTAVLLLCVSLVHSVLYWPMVFTTAVLPILTIFVIIAVTLACLSIKHVPNALNTQSRGSH